MLLYIHNCSAGHRECTLNHRREQQSLLPGQLSPVDREAERLSRASAKLYSSSCPATAVDKENSLKIKNETDSMIYEV